MNVNKYTVVFTEHMKLVPHLVPIEPSKINKFDMGSPMDFCLTVKLEITLNSTIWVASNVETQVKEKGLKKAKTREKGKFEGSSRSDKKSRFLKSGPNEKRFGDTIEAKWCEKCRNKHFGRCSNEVNCFNYGNIGHYANNCTQSMCYKYKGAGHFKIDCPKKNKAARSNASPKPKKRELQIILDEVGVATGDQE